MKALYRSPRLCGKRISLKSVMSVPRPTPNDAVAHSPTPSTVSIAASSKGDTRKQEAAWLMWCSENRIGPLYAGSSLRIKDGIHSFSWIQSGIAFRNDEKDRGNVAMYVDSIRSNFNNGLS